jgi:hypothetical protein
MNYFLGLALNCDPPDCCLPSGWDYRHALLCELMCSHVDRATAGNVQLCKHPHNLLLDPSHQYLLCCGSDNNFGRFFFFFFFWQYWGLNSGPNTFELFLLWLFLREGLAFGLGPPGQ